MSPGTWPLANMFEHYGLDLKEAAHHSLLYLLSKNLVFYQIHGPLQVDWPKALSSCH